MFQKAQRKRSKARIGISGVAGSGKTYSAILIAKGLGKSIAMIDTENGSGELYSHLADYDVLTLRAPFTPEKYIEGIKEAEKAGYEVLIIDSLSHAWAGEGGLLDLQGKIADSGKGNSYTAWRSVTPKHNALVEAILQSSCHIIATMRAKTEYVQQQNNGRTEIKKVGLAPVQRDGMEYEFTIFLDLASDHTAIASKDRTSIFDNTYFKPSTEIGDTKLKWLEQGSETTKTEMNPEQDNHQAVTNMTIEALNQAKSMSDLEAIYKACKSGINKLPDSFKNKVIDHTNKLKESFKDA